MSSGRVHQEIQIRKYEPVSGTDYLYACVFNSSQPTSRILLNSALELVLIWSWVAV